MREAARSDNRISFLGQRSPEDIYALMGDAKFLVMPSVWAEPFGLTVIEAFAKGTPVLASRVGALTEMVREEETGALFEPGNAENLAASVRNILGSPVLSSKMRCAARAEFETRYDRDANYEQLVNVYREAINVKRAGTVPLANVPIART